MTHEPPQQGHAAALQTKKPSLLSVASDSVSLRIRRRCQKRLRPLDIPTTTTDDSKDALSFRWWALPATTAPDADTQRAAPDAIVRITIVPPALASLAVTSLSSLDCSLAAGLSRTARIKVSCRSTLF